ncbi:MAG: extracellular solute-binding protein [Rubrimonas sp.]
MTPFRPVPPVALSAALAAMLAGPLAAQELNALVWCDHLDDALIRPFEQAHGVRVNLRDYEGTGAALSIIEQSRPGDWDVLVIDGVDVPRAVAAGILAPLPEDQLPLDDIFPEVMLEANQRIDGRLYAVTEKFGYNTLSFNGAAISAADLADMTTLWSGRFGARFAVYDYYLPVMGLVALGLGIDTADISADNLPRIREALFALKDAAVSVGEVVASQTAIATGEVDALFGGGEWVTAALTGEHPDLDWMIPDQGAVMWSQSIGVFADSRRQDLALAFVRHVLSPEGQAALATSECYWAMPANRRAAEHLTEDQKRALRWDDQPDYLSRVQLYPAPDAELDAAMQDVWAEFLAR